MITESKSCYDCGTKIPAIKNNLLQMQTDDFGISFEITTITVQCRRGHKNPVTINHMEEPN